MKTFLTTFCVLGMSAASMAQVLNPGFELGGSTLQNWTTVGHSIPMTDTIGISPAGGARMAMAITASDGTVNPAVVPGSGVLGTTASSQLGLSANALDLTPSGAAVKVSAVFQNITLSAGNIVRFRYNFLTNQTYNDGSILSIKPKTTNNDFCFMSVSGPSSSVSVLADTFLGFVDNPLLPGGFATGFSITPTSNPFISASGWRTGSFTAPTAGTYRFAVGVVHATIGPENGVNSAVLVDNVEVVPEPASLVVLGGLAAGIIRRRKHDRRSY